MSRGIWIATCALAWLIPIAANGQSGGPKLAAKTDAGKPTPANTAKKESPPAIPPEDSADLVQMPDNRVWVDKKNKRVILEGQVCLTEGTLELFACPRLTKEHEAVVSISAKAFVVHAALLAVGAKPGHPATWMPEYQPAEGQIIDVWVYWRDVGGEQRSARAQEWVLNRDTGQQMTHDWVFAGSRMWKDQVTGKEHYMAEEGDLICVSNFASAMLDLPVKSSEGDSSLLFEAYTERIPPRDTPVRIMLSPRTDKQVEVAEQPTVKKQSKAKAGKKTPKRNPARKRPIRRRASNR